MISISSLTQLTQALEQRGFVITSGKDDSVFEWTATKTLDDGWRMFSIIREPVEAIVFERQNHGQEPKLFAFPNVDNRTKVLELIAHYDISVSNG